jgi:hypothetical protein
LRKYTLIILCIVSTACSVAKKNLQVEAITVPGEMNLIEEVKALNITNGDFNILKSEIKVSNDIESQKMICNIRYQKQGTYLISLKSQAGIEAARIFITKDTILINDRINKKIFYGDPDYLLEKYGITSDVLPVIIGDYISDVNSDEEIKCLNGKTFIKKTEGDKEIVYTIDCKKKKITNVSSLDTEAHKGIVLRFDRFIEKDKILIPGNIEITDTNEETTILIRIEKVETELESDITFIPGKNYEKVLLK